MLKIGYQGVYGSYSSIASLNFFGENCEFYGYDSFQLLADNLLEGNIDFAVFPIENSTTGQIYRTLDILKNEESFFAIGEIIVDVKHNLITFPSATIEDLKFVYSHPEALGQCLNFFAKYPHIKPISYEDTAKSVSYIKELGNKENGAIASFLAGQAHDMSILNSSIQDMDENKTRFLVFKKDINKYQDIQAKFEGKGKISCYFETKHKTGELFKILEIFSRANYNLLSLHSRSTKKNSFEYGFFVDADCRNSNSSDFGSLIKELKDNLTYFNLLGIYDV